MFLTFPMVRIDVVLPIVSDGSDVSDVSDVLFLMFPMFPMFCF